MHPTVFGTYPDMRPPRIFGNTFVFADPDVGGSLLLVPCHELLGSLNGDHGLNGDHDDPEDAYRDDDAQERQLVAMLSQVATGGGSPASQFGQHETTPPPARGARRRKGPGGDQGRSPSSEWSDDGSAGGGSLLSTATPFGKRAARAANAASDQDREDELTAMLMRAMSGAG